MTYRKRAFTTLVAGALALPFLASPALANHGGPVAGPPQDISTFCENPFPENFVDVQNTDVFAQAIQCIATAGRETASPTNPNGDPITVGGPEGSPSNQYGPNRSVLRGQMASFIARMLDSAERRDVEEVPGPGRVQALPAYDGSNEFRDVPANFVHVQNINRLADAGIVLGGPNGRASDIYAPNEFISRAQMASFINRAAAYAQFQDPNNSGRGTGYTTTQNFFVDSGEIAVHQANINGLASVGIVVGVQPTNEHRYAPRANVTRAQMAGFISRSLAQLFDNGRVHSLLEVFTGNFTAASREDRDEASNTRSYEARALQPGQEYRVTLVQCDNIEREGNGLVNFDRADGGFADASGTSATIAGGANDSANSARFTPGADGVIRFTVTSDAEECVRPVLYINGGPGQNLREGGNSPRLEVDGEGRPVEFFGLAGAVRFVNEAEPVAGEATVATEGGSVAPGDSFTATVTASNDQPIESVTVTGECVDQQVFTAPDDDTTALAFEVEINEDAELGDCVLTFVTRFQNGTTDSDQVTVNIAEGPQIQEARVATDAAMATDGGMATETASDGDVFEITFDRVATDSATASATVTFVDDDGDEFTAQCVANDGDAAATGNTAASCFLSDDGRTLRIELLQDPVVDGDGSSDGVVRFPVTIIDTDGITDEQGNEVDLVNSEDTTAETDDETARTDDPAPNSPNSP